MKLSRKFHSRAGFTLVDAMVALMVVVTSFIGVYALGGQCAYLLSSGKELTSAQQVLQDRIEQLRNLNWTQVTDSNYLANNVLNQARQNGGYLTDLTETVTIYAYPPPAAPTPTPIQLTVSTNGTVAINTTNSAIASGNLCRIDVTESWTTARTGQTTRSVTNTTVQANKSR